MIPKLDEKPQIQDSAAAQAQGAPSSPPPQQKQPTEKRSPRRNSPKRSNGKQHHSPSPLHRRNFNDSCSSINSTVMIPSDIVTSAQQALHTNTAPGTRVTPPRSTAKAVCFNKRVRIRKIKRLEDMSAEELEATYFTDEELMNIRNELRFNIRAMVQANHREDQHETMDDYDDRKSSGFCVRGLEHEFPLGKLRRKQLKMMSRGAVLEEQRLQRQFRVGRGGNNNKTQNSISSHSTSTASTLSTCDSSINSFHHFVDEEADVAISEIYRIESKPAVQLALEFGKRDEAIADQIYFAHQAI